MVGALVVSGCLLLLLAVACLTWFPKFFVRRARLHPDRAAFGGDAAKYEELRLRAEADRLKAETDARTALLQALGGLAILAGVIIGVLQLHETQQKNEKDTELAVQRQQTEQFIRTVDQLGASVDAGAQRVPKVEIRLGGIFGLESILMGIRTAARTSLRSWPRT